jgi:hypothetical protein
MPDTRPAQHEPDFLTAEDPRALNLLDEASKADPLGSSYRLAADRAA